MNSLLTILLHLWWFVALAAFLPALGACFVLLLQEVAGGAWVQPVEGRLRWLARLLPLTALGFVPLWLGWGTAFYWVSPEAADQALVEARQAYFNPSFFIARSVAIFAGFAFVGWRLGSASRKLFAAAPLLLALTVASLFFTVDWVMVRSPHWWSSGFPFTLILAGAMSALGVSLFWSRTLGTKAAEAHRRPLGTLLFAFLNVFLYLGLIEFVITYAGDLPPKRGFYTERLGLLAGPVIFMGFAFGALPAFLNLLSLKGKTNSRRLRWSAGAVCLLAVCWAWWVVAPLTAWPDEESKEPRSAETSAS
ncbi:MAG: hypothetical protein ACFB21_05320 [Opitutales bacterium]